MKSSFRMTTAIAVQYGYLMLPAFVIFSAIVAALLWLAFLFNCTIILPWLS